MNRRTIEQLIALNQEFYRSSATEFDASRRSPWPGWKRVLDAIDRTREVSILDVGCGNGRFGLYAGEELGERMRYCGVDSSAELLAAARSRGGSDWRLIEADVLCGPLPLMRAEERFDLVCCFGVMHHVPGEGERRALLERMAARLAPGGHLAVSFWQFGGDERFQLRQTPWSVLGRTDFGEIEEADLEPGDYLLRWGGMETETDEALGPLRYCHYCDPSEVRRLSSLPDLTTADTFRADGRSGDLNLYLLLTRDG